MQVVDLQLRRVDKITHELGFKLEVSEAAKEFLAREGYDPAFSARPLKRAIQRRLQDPLAMRLLEEGVPEGSCVWVELAENQKELVFDVPEVSGAQVPDEPEPREAGVRGR